MSIFIPGRNEQVGTLIGTDSKDTKNYGTYHMAARPDLFEPMRTNNFEFIVFGLNQKINESGNPYEVHTDGDLNAEDVLRLSIDGAFQPHFKQNPVSVKRGNSTLYYAGAPTFDAGQIKLKDYIGLNAKLALMSWQNLSYNVRTEKIGLASDYKLTCYIKEYTPDYILIRTWVVEGCWITGITESGYDAANADNLNQITATIQYDKAYPEFKEVNTDFATSISV